MNRETIAQLLAAHYTAKMGGKVSCFYDEATRAYCIRGEGLPPHPDLREQYPNGWSMLDYIKPADARALVDADRQNIRTHAGKQEFIRNFMNSVRDELYAKVKDMPEDWDGFELRWLIADKFNYEQRYRGADFRCFDRAWQRRIKAYANERMTRNL